MEYHQRCCLEFFGTSTPPTLEYSIDQMEEMAKDVVNRGVAVPGVQPKLSLSLIKEVKEKSDSWLTVVDALGGLFILKPPAEDYPEMPQNEHLTMRMAEAFGIQVVPSSLIRLKSGELSYITKRVDRTADGQKIHMIDMFQITEAFDKYKSSMEKIGKAIEAHSDNTVLDKIFYFEIAVFSFLTGNNDMHLKNFSMIESPSGWILSPAYDLLNVSILNPEDKEELALPIGGKKNKLTKQHLIDFGLELGLTEKQIKGVFKRMMEHRADAFKWINDSFLSAEMQEAYRSTLQSKYSQIGL